MQTLSPPRRFHEKTYKGRLSVEADTGKDFRDYVFSEVDGSFCSESLKP